MKYVWIVIAVVLIVRIDVFLKLFDKTVGKIEKSSTTETKISDISASQELIPIADNAALKSSPKTTFINLLNNFHQSPRKDNRELALNELRTNPTMFNSTLDKDFESQVYLWRDLVTQGSEEAGLFLVELMKYTTGENYNMIRRFFSLWIDADIDEFLKLYSKSKDSNCQAITLFADPVPDDERLGELYERETDLNEFLTKQASDPILKKYADTCLLMLKVEISKLAPAPVPSAAPVNPEGN